MADEAVQQIKDRLSIVDVITPYVKLTKSGKYYKGLSPFTKEKTPSFFVSPDRGLYHCFSSGKGGDMFTFVQEMEGLDFRGALAHLAERAGVTLSQESSGARNQKEKVLAALSDANAYFQKKLETHQEAREYLASRSVREETVSSFTVGFAPDSWRDCLEHLTTRGHSEDVLLEAGLVKRPESKQESVMSNEQSVAPVARPYDRFRNRIMFPIRDLSGRVVGFSGRHFGNSTEEGAKYLNSPETSVFSKSHILYGLHEAKEGIRKYGFAILVEGQFDLLMAHQAGYTNTVALSGTAFTEHHARLVKRYTTNLLVAFDGDRAGVAAAGRAAQVSLPQGLNVKIASFPSGEDPADLIKRDVGLWKEAIKTSLPVVDFYLEYLKRLGFDERRFRLEASRVVLPYIPLIENAIDRAHFTERVASALLVPVRAVEIELEKVQKNTSNQESVIRNQKAHHHNPQSGVSHTETVSETYEPFLSRSDTLERLLFGIIQVLKDTDSASSDMLRKDLERLVGSERVLRLEASADEKRVALIEGDLFLESNASISNKQELFRELIHDFQKEIGRTTYREAVLRLKDAEKRGDASEVERLVKEIHELAKTL